MKECPNCLLYRRALIDIGLKTGMEITPDMPLAQVIALAKGAVYGLVEREEEQKAPIWTRDEIIKPVKDEDLYVMWVNSADGPGWVGTRAEAEAYGVPKSRLDRADANGTSVRGGGGHNWDSPGVIADQVGWLPRHLIGAYAKAVAGGACNAEGLKLLEPFDDSPSVDWEGELALSELHTFAQDQFKDDHELIGNVNGFHLVKVNGQRALITAVSKPEHGMPAMVTVMRF